MPPSGVGIGRLGTCSERLLRAPSKAWRARPRCPRRARTAFRSGPGAMKKSMAVCSVPSTMIDDAGGDQQRLEVLEAPAGAASASARPDRQVERLLRPRGFGAWAASAASEPSAVSASGLEEREQALPRRVLVGTVGRIGRGGIAGGRNRGGLAARFGRSAGRTPPSAASDAAMRAAGEPGLLRGTPEPGSSGVSGGRFGSIGRPLGAAAAAGGAACGGCGWRTDAARGVGTTRSRLGAARRRWQCGAAGDRRRLACRLRSGRIGSRLRRGPGAAPRSTPARHARAARRWTCASPRDARAGRPCRARWRRGC